MIKKTIANMYMIGLDIYKAYDGDITKIAITHFINNNRWITLLKI